MKPVLLLVDLQGDHLSTLQTRASADSLIRYAAKLLNGCRDHQVPVIHIWTTFRRGKDRLLPHLEKSGRWICEAGTDGHKSPTILQPIDGELIIHKTGFNGFAGGSLDKALKKANCDTLIIAGLHLHVCVRAVTVEGIERGLRVLIVDDAVASNDPVLSAGTRRWLISRCAEFVSLGEILSCLDGHAPASLLHRSPHETRKILFEIPVATPGEIASVTSIVREAQNTWRQKRISSRLESLSEVASLLEKTAPKLARQMAVEIGKPIAQGLEEIRRAATNIRDVAGRAKRFKLKRRETAGWVRYEPVGVIAVISPWNNPVAIPLGKIAPALAYGNTVVWKSAPATTAVSQKLLKMLYDAGIPQNVVRLLPGDHSTAQALAASKNIDAVTITSSAAAGYAVHEICAKRFLPLQAELSGNNAAIVWGDANLSDAAGQIVRGAFGFAGQRCTANRRVIVQEEIFDVFLNELKIAAGKLRWGDPVKKSTDIGPLIHTGKRDEHMALIDGVKDGDLNHARVLFKMKQLKPWMKSGAYAQPVVMHCDDPMHPLVQEETMSPLLVVQCAKNFGHALELCNGVRHGLAAALFTESARLKKVFLAGAHAGILKINSTTAGVDVSLPFGGWKMSGLGPPEHGVGDALFYTRMQAVYGTSQV